MIRSVDFGEEVGKEVFVALVAFGGGIGAVVDLGGPGGPGGGGDGGTTTPAAVKDKITELCLRAFSRPPKSKELDAYVQYVSSAPDNEKRQAYEDVLWALMNTKEFLFNH